MSTRNSHQLFGDTELEIMQIAWARDRVTVREVVHAIRAARPVAYTTIQTIVLKLARKGFLSQVEGTRSPGIFVPSATRAETFTQAVEALAVDLELTTNEWRAALASLIRRWRTA